MRTPGRLRSIAPLLAVAAALALVACGSDEENGTGAADGGANGASVGSGGEANETIPPKTPTGKPSDEAEGEDAGAGGGGEKIDPENPIPNLSPEQQVDYAIKGVLASGQPALACEQVATERYVETAFGNVAGCRRATVPASAAAFLEVTKIKIDGSKATAQAVPTGGPSDGETIDVKLVREDGIWKVDSLKSDVPVGP